MTNAYWRALREISREGDEFDQLAFKMFQEFLLSPTLGIGFQHLQQALEQGFPFSRFYEKTIHAMVYVPYYACQSSRLRWYHGQNASGYHLRTVLLR